MTKQELKDSISLVINTNGSGGITGANLQEKLFEVVDDCYNFTVLESIESVFFNQKFITESDLDVSDKYTITVDDLDKSLIFYIDKNIHPDFQVLVPETLDYTFEYEVHIPRIIFTFIDAGTYQLNNTGEFIKQVSLSDVNMNGTAESHNFLVTDGDDGSISLLSTYLQTTNIDGTLYTDAYLALTSNLQDRQTFHLIESGNTIILKNGVNVIFSDYEGIQPDIETLTINCITDNIARGSEVVIQFDCNVNDLSWIDVNGETPNFVVQNQKVRLRKVYVEGIGWFMKMVSNLQDEFILTLKQVTYTDINAATATTDIEIPLPNIRPGFYLDKLFVEVTNDFDATINLSTFQLGSIGFSEPIDLLNLNKKMFDVGASNDHLVGITDIKLYIDFNVGGNEVNPQNLTRGIIKVKALIKKFPI